MLTYDIIVAGSWELCSLLQQPQKSIWRWHRQKSTHQQFISVMFVQTLSISPGQIRGATKKEEHITCRTRNGTHLQYLQKWEWELLFLISLRMKLKQSGPHTCVCEVTWVQWGLMALWGLWDFWEMAVIGFRLWLLSWGVRGKLWRTSTRRQTGCSRSAAG